MARKSEHNIYRKLYQNNSDNNSVTVNDALYSLFISSLKNPIITEDVSYISYQKVLDTYKNQKDTLLSQHSKIKRELPPSPVAKEYWNETFHFYLNFKKKHISNSILDIERFLSEWLNFSITQRNIIKEYFDTTYIKSKLGIATFKDNANDSCSDKIILFNLAMLLIVNKSCDAPFPYPILSEDYADVLNYIKTFSEPTDELFFLYNALVQKKFRRSFTIFSNECILLYLARRNICTLHGYDSFCYGATRYLQSERQFLLKQIKLQEFDFIKSFLSLISVDMDDNKEKWSTDIKKHYRKLINNINALRSDVETHSSELFLKYCSCLPDLILEANQNNEITNILRNKNDFSEAVDNIFRYLEDSIIDNKSLLYTRYVTILNNLAPTNNLHELIELLYNICIPEDDNITALAHEIFVRECDTKTFKYIHASKDDLVKILKYDTHILPDAELFARFFSIYICDSMDWTFLCSLIACQNDKPDWYNRFYKIIQNIRGDSFIQLHTIFKDY